MSGKDFDLEQAMEFLKTMELTLSESYQTSSMIWTVVLGILSFSLVLFVALVIKRARVLGILAAVAQPVGLFAARQSVMAYGELQFYTRTNAFIEKMDNGQFTQAQAEAEAKAFMTPLFTELIFCAVWMLLAIVCTVLLGIYMVMLIKVAPRAFGIVGLVLTGIKWAGFLPVNLYGLLLKSMTEEGQILNDIAYRGLTVLPILLIAILAILVLNQKKKGLIPATETAESPVTEPEETLESAPEESPAE